MPTIAVVVPAIDEAESLPALLADLGAQHGAVLDVVVVDGGSTDDTASVAAAYGHRVIASVAGRAVQMNAGAAATEAPWLCFLHADSRLTHPDQLAAAVAALASAPDTRHAGHFPLRFSGRPVPRLFYRFLEAKTRTGRRLTINGDQGLVIARPFFEALGGYDTRLDFLEDQRLAAAVARHGRWQRLAHPLATSPRRFQREGAFARFVLMGLIMGAYELGLAAFFERAPEVYARQAGARRLRLGPYAVLLDDLRRACGWRASTAAGWRVAGLLCAQSWQLVLLADVLVWPPHGGGRALSRAWTRLPRYRVLRWPAQTGAFVVLALLCFGVLAPWWRWVERCRLGR